MANHTPGPWRHVIISYSAVEDTPTGSIFAGKTRVCSGILDDVKDRQEATANARLIAAAPNMLDALRKAHTVLTSTDLSQGQLSTVIKECRYAILLAT